MFKNILAISLIAFSLTACASFSSLNESGEFPTADQITTDVNQACELRETVLNASFDINEAIDVICAVAKTNTTTAQFRQSDVLSSCAKTEDYSYTKEWRSSCPLRLKGGVETMLRSITLATQAIQSVRPDFKGPDVVISDKPVPSPCGYISFAAACKETVYIFPDEFDGFGNLIGQRDIAVAALSIHETAHIWQFTEGRLKSYGTSASASRKAELEADCISGYVAKWFIASKDQITKGLLLASLIGGDPHGTHGSGEQRKASVYNGYENGFEKCLT